MLTDALLCLVLDNVLELLYFFAMIVIQIRLIYIYAEIISS